MTDSELRGLIAYHTMCKELLCDMIEEYAKARSLRDLSDCWKEVRESLDALFWLEKEVRRQKR